MIQIIHQNHPWAKELFIDPEVENVRVIKCYRNAGFKSVGELVKLNIDDVSTHGVIHCIEYVVDINNIYGKYAHNLRFYILSSCA